MDTVGAVCMDAHGHLCAGVSSGGVVYKAPGRIGQVSFRSPLCRPIRISKYMAPFFTQQFYFC